jgi:hypothetical protein
MIKEKIIVGRESEIKKINLLFETENAELAIVLSRCRIEKTYVIKNTYASKIIIHFTGGKLSETEISLLQRAIKLTQASKGKEYYYA